MGNHLTAETLLGDLRGDGYRVQVEGGRLYLAHPTRKKPSPAVMAEVSRLRADLIRLLTPPAEPPPPPPEAPIRRRDRLEAAAVAHRLASPPCGCGRCAREDAEARWRREDRWSGY